MFFEVWPAGIALLCGAALFPRQGRQTQEEAGITVLGTVGDGRGCAVRGARVTLSSQSSSASHAVCERSLDLVGSDFRFDGAQSGLLVLRATCPGFLDGESELGTIVPGDVVFDARVTLRGASTLRGRVRDLEGEVHPATDVWVVEDLRDAVAARHCDPQGRFEIDGLGPGPWSVWAAAGEGSALLLARAFDVKDAAADLELRLAPPGSIVVDAPHFRPESLEVHVHSGDEALLHWKDRSPFPVRSFPASSLAAGRYWVDVTEPERALGAWLQVEVCPRETTRIEPELAPLMRVRVRTVEAGLPAPAQLVLRAAAGWTDERPTGCMVADTGVEEFLLPVGDYVLHAQRERTRATVEFDLVGERERLIEVVLR